MKTKIRKKQNTDDIAEIESIVASFPGDEKSRFIEECDKHARDEIWCKEHGTSSKEPDYGIITRETYREQYVEGIAK